MMRTRVVLVGNGPSAISFAAGNVIDSCDLVVRFNEFVKVGYEQFVGSRTDVWVVNAVSEDLSRATDSRSVLVCPPYTRLNEAARAVEVLRARAIACETVPASFVSAIEREFRFHVTPRGWGMRYPSTGAIAAAYLVERYGRVYIHGFDLFAGSSHHYFDTKTTAAERTWHDAAAEERFFQRMALLGRVLPLPVPCAPRFRHDYFRTK